MADGYHMGQIERPALGEDAQMVSRRAPIKECAGPAAARIADLQILDIPGGDAVCRERARQWRCVTQGRIALRPAAAVNNHRDGEGSAALRQAQLAKLQLIGVVRFNQRGFRRGQRVDVLRRHGLGDGRSRRQHAQQHG